jgi:hypothetical protein
MQKIVMTVIKRFIREYKNWYRFFVGPTNIYSGRKVHLKILQDTVLYRFRKKNRRWSTYLLRLSLYAKELWKGWISWIHLHLWDSHHLLPFTCYLSCIILVFPLFFSSPLIGQYFYINEIIVTFFLSFYFTSFVKQLTLLYVVQYIIATVMTL